MAKAKDKYVKLECEECGRINYHTHKNHKTVKERLKIKKFCKWCNKHISHKENKW